MGSLLVVKNLPANAGDEKTWARSLGQEDPLEKEMANHSSILVWEIPQTEEAAGYSPWDRKELDMSEATEHASTFIHIYVQIHIL